MTHLPATLGEVCEFIVDCLHSTAPTQEDGYPLIRTPNIGKGRLNLDKTYRVSEEVYQNWTRRAVPESGDLILAREAPAGNVALVQSGQEVCLGQRTVHIRPDRRKVDPVFLCYYLLAPPQQAALLASETGATAKHVNMKDIRRLRLMNLPHFDVQVKIGKVLASYDDLFENNHRRIQLIEESARLLYKEWFVHLRFPGHEHVNVVNDVPEGWRYQSLEKLADVVMGQSPKSEFYNEDGDGLPFHQGVTSFGLRYPEHKIYCTVKNRLAEPGDILFSVRAPVGRINLANDKVVIGRGISAIRSKYGQQNFLHYALKSHFFKEDMIGGGAIFASVSKKELFGVKLLQPAEPVVRLFMDYVKLIDQQVDNLTRANKKLARARDLLLPKLMSGELAT